jgi:hypothetical protein
MEALEAEASVPLSRAMASQLASGRASHTPSGNLSVQACRHSHLALRGSIPRREVGVGPSQPKRTWSTVAPIDADSRERAARVKAAQRRRVALTRDGAPGQ